MKLPFGKKKDTTHTQHGNDNVQGEGRKDIGSPATKKGRSFLMIATFLGLASWLVLLVGTALLQKFVHNKKYERNGFTSNAGSYRDALQSAHWTPYPNDHSRQWMFLWWIIAISMFTWLATLLLGPTSARIVQWRSALIGFHIYVLVLCTFAIDAFLLIVHENTHKRYFGHKRFDVALAGLFGLAFAHALATLALGMLANHKHLDNRNMTTGIRERIIEKEVAVPAPATHHSTHREETHMEESAPVRVHTGGARVTDASPHVGYAEPVKVHMGGAIPHSGPKELGTRRY